MTIGMAWVGTHRDGREYLWMASDSRTRGGFVMDSSPKLMPLARSDCAICFAGDTASSYPLMMQISAAIAAHQPARERSLDLVRLMKHLLRVCTDIVGRITDASSPIERDEVQFLFGGYSWRNRAFELWTIYFDPSKKSFAARPANNFHPRLQKAAFIGDWAKKARTRVFKSVANSDPPETRPVNLDPFRVLVEMLRESGPGDTIGGPPQLLRITAHLNTRPLCVTWGGGVTLFGRQLFDYENCDFWIIDPDTMAIDRPRKFGYRDLPPGGDRG